MQPNCFKPKDVCVTCGKAWMNHGKVKHPFIKFERPCGAYPQSLPPSILEPIDNAFIYHAPKGDQVERYQSIRDKGKDLALHIASNCPYSIERDEAIKKLREAIMWANASIACNE